jgi:hypothetical protein
MASGVSPLDLHDVPILVHGVADFVSRDGVSVWFPGDLAARSGEVAGYRGAE